MAAARVVSGEAAESDLSEEEESEAEKKRNANTPDAAIITGEASESDEEPPKLFSSSAAASLDKNIPSAVPRSFNSLLHKKLVECNANLHEDIQRVLKSTVSNSLSQLSSIDKQLLKSQLRLQQANSSLKLLESSSLQLAAKLNIAAFGSYIPQISIPLPKED